MLGPPDKQLKLLLLLIVAFNVIPHTVSLPVWVTVSAASFLLWAGLHLYNGTRLPPRWARAFFVLAGAVGVFFQWHTIVGQEPATGLLVYLATLKLLESTKYRDAMLVIFTCYFLLMAHLLASQSLPSTLYMAADVLFITSLMFHLHKRDRRSSVRSFRPAMKLLAVSLPVWIFLFIVFPRFSAGFWRLSSPPPAQTGFTDNMSPGDVERMVESDEIAFRVTFPRGQKPYPEALYWRGAILSISEGGLRWSRAPKALPPEAMLPSSTEPVARIEQEIVLEPLFRKWLFGLDYPRMIEFDDPSRRSMVARRPGLVFESEKDVSSRVIYQVLSSLQAPKQRLSENERQLYLQSPIDIEPQVLALAEKLKAETNGSTTALVASVESYFEKQGFHYTRTPGLLGGPNELSRFLFETKRGFCEHYSGAFSTLMRLMGVPARVVVGFQGGQINEFGDYYVVRSRDAHAWAEVWSDEENRWKRVDPTATIAPLRIQLGGDFHLLDPNQIKEGMTIEMIRTGLTRGRLGAFSARMQRAWDAAAMNWNNFLLRYDFAYQQELFSRLGLGSGSRWIFFVWLGAGLVIFIIVLQYALRRQSRKQDPLLWGYHRFCTRLEKAGLPRKPNEGPLDFIARAKEFRPSQAEEIETFGHQFVELRYGRASTEKDRNIDLKLKDFRKRAAGFKVQPAPAQRSDK